MSKTAILTSVFTAIAVIGGVSVTSLTVSAPAMAQAGNAKQIVDNAKAEGLIGETAGGYLAVVNSAPRDIVNAMNEINIRRRSLYTQLARKQNVQIDEVATVTAEKVRAKAKSGEKYLTKDADWVTIP